MSWISILSCLAGVGVFLKLFEVIYKSGEISLNQVTAKLHCKTAYSGLLIEDFDVELSFTNSSGYKEKLKKVTAEFCYNRTSMPLVLFDSGSNTTAVIKPKSFNCLELTLLPLEREHVFTLDDLHNNFAFLEIHYFLKKVEQKLIVPGKGIHWEKEEGA